MIGSVSAALLEMQGAVVARSLYPSGHPRISACEARAGALLAECLEQTPEITLFALDDRVIFNGEILPRTAWADQGVRQADAVEVVTIVGGGS